MTRKVALLIGVSEYGEGIPSLSAPLNDVEAMKRILENPKMGGFDDVKVLKNPESINAIQTAVAEIFANCDKEDLVLLYFSGHGITDDNNRLFLAIKGTSKNYYKATSVSASFVQDTSQDCYAKRQVIILDCCYSGAFAEGWQTKSIGLDIRKELGAEGRVVLTSSSATQTSFQQEGEELSLYTKYFIEGIETGVADKQGTGKIYVHQIHDYAKEKVQEVKPKQKPDIILDKEGYNIILSQAPIKQNQNHEQKSVNLTPNTPKKPKIEAKKEAEPISEEFIKLRDLLAEGKWKEADKENTWLMLQLGDKRRKGYLNKEDCEKFPREELRTIDQLWLKYSDGKFGFSVQKQIYLEVGGRLNYPEWKSYEKMSDRIGWRVKRLKKGFLGLVNKQETEWLSYSDLSFNINAPQGHLPAYTRWGYWGSTERLEHESDKREVCFIVMILFFFLDYNR